jgi:RNA polymerase primary sigma factor
MQVDGLTRHLADHRFCELFRDELGWDCSKMTMAIQVGKRQLAFEGVAQKDGLQVLQCNADRRALADRSLLRSAQSQVARALHEHLLIYSCDRPAEQVWQWAVRLSDGTGVRHTVRPFSTGSPPDSFLKRLCGPRSSFDRRRDIDGTNGLERVPNALGESTKLDLLSQRSGLMSRSDELAIRMVHGDRDASREFVVLHRPLARQMSKWVKVAFGLTADDAEQIGAVGLIEAARRFDPARGIRFSTYAKFWIYKECQTLGPEFALFIWLPNLVRQTFFPLRNQYGKLKREFGAGRANDELARWCAKDCQFYQRWVDVDRALSVRSLQSPAWRTNLEARDPRAPVRDEPLPALLAKERHGMLRAAMAYLKARDRRIVSLRYGINVEPRSVSEIAQLEGMTAADVRKRLKCAKCKLRTVMERKFKDLVPARLGR